MFKRAKLPRALGLTLASAVAVCVILYPRLLLPLETTQQTVVSGSTRVVVVLIPDFPIESVLMGVPLGFVLLHIVRRRTAGERLRKR